MSGRGKPDPDEEHGGRGKPDPDRRHKAVGASPIRTEEHGGRGEQEHQEGWGLPPRSAALEF